MVEAVLAAFATSAGTGAAAAAGSAAIAGPVTAAASGAATLGSFATLGNALSLFGALGSISGGNQQASAYKLQARQEELNARLETVKAEDTANALRRNLLANIGTANATFAARGIGLGSGTPEQAKIVGANNASRNIESARFGGEIASLDRQVQAGQYRSAGRAARTQGYFNAARGLAGSSGITSLLNL